MSDHSNTRFPSVLAMMLPTGDTRWRTLITCLFAFLLPLAPSLLPLFTVLVLVVHLVDPTVWECRPLMRIRLRDPAPWALLLFMLHVVGMAWTTNTEFGWFDVGIKLPLLLFPLLTFLPGIRTIGKRTVLGAFCMGNAVAVVVCLLLAAVRAFSADGQGSQEFLSSRFSAMLHPSYMGWYLNVALAFFFLDGAVVRWSRWTAILFMTLICTGVVLAEARMSWITLLVVLGWSLVHGWRDARKRRMLLTIIMLSLLAGSVLTASSEYVRWRVMELFTTRADQPADAVGSAAVRTVVWKAAWDVGNSNIPLGTGTGDVKDELLLRYKEIGATHAFEGRLNAHNQFLQTFAALGVPGVVALVFMFLLPATGLFRGGSPMRAVRACVLLLTALNFGVESMLEVQAGVLFTAFICWVLWWPEEAAPSSRS